MTKAIFITGVTRGLGAAFLGNLIAVGHTPIGIGRGARLDCDMSDTVQVSALRLSVPGGTTEVVFISNAGTIEPLGAIGGRANGGVAEAITVNLIAPIAIVERLATLCRAKEIPLTVLHIGSGAARQAIPGWSAYCAAKAGAAMFYKCLALENPDWRIMDIDPGVMDTGMQAAIRKSGAGPAGENLRDPAVVAKEILAQYL